MSSGRDRPRPGAAERGDHGRRRSYSERSRSRERGYADDLRAADPYSEEHGEPPRPRRDLGGYDPMPRRLYRDPRKEKIGGVCAGIARYYGVEPWVVRCIAVTGLLFFPTIVFPAYWVAYFVMDKPPESGDDLQSDSGWCGRHKRRQRSESSSRHGRYDHASPAPELGPRFSPRYSLRNVQADLTEVELRLRRMETHVTSGRYELQRELNRIERG